MIFVEFLALARGRAVAAIFLMTTSFVPLMAVSSLDLAYALVYELIVGSILALLLIFLAHALFPERGVSQQAVVQDTREGAPLAAALANTGVLMSLFVYFMGTGIPTSIIVIMVTAIAVLQQSAAAGPGVTFGTHRRKHRRRSCRDGRLSADHAPSLASLPFSGRAVLRPGLRGRDCHRWQIRPLYAVGTATFLVVLGLGLSPLPQDSATIFLSRISTVIFASLYTIGIASVLRGLFVGVGEAGGGTVAKPSRSNMF